MRIKVGSVPSAKMTGKLSISLVNASCVLEVFVSIILVGEHLAAPRALESVATVCCKVTTSIVDTTYTSNLALKSHDLDNTQSDCPITL